MWLHGIHMFQLCRKHSKELTERDFCVGGTKSLYTCMLFYFQPLYTS